MTDCIFCKIINGKLPCHKVYEDDQFLAFLDIHPETIGHTQLIPKTHYRWVWDIPNIGEYFETARRIARAQMQAFDTQFITSKIMGEAVYHAHTWLIPRANTEITQGFSPRPAKMTDAELANIANSISKYI